MLDQTFSAKNFMLISDAENRRGANVNSHFFPSVKSATDAVKLAIQNLRTFRKTHPKPYSPADFANYQSLLDIRDSAKKSRDETLDQSLAEVAKKISSKAFEIEFTRVPGPKAKAICVLADKPENYYATKLLCRNLQRLYGVKQANKNVISSQLCAQLSDPFPYYLVRLDLSEFYESIDQNTLKEKVRRDLLLSATSMKLINSALDKYASLASTPGKGLPRGLGISAYLAELYMREFDSEIRNGAEVVYYSRYVDDIVVLFAPTKSSDVGSYFGWIQSCVSKHKLQINPAAGKTSTFIKDDGAWSFEYLGYKYEGPSNSLKIKLSDKKFSRYQARVKKCFQEYHATRHKSLKGAHRLLVQRMRFLTGNTRLLHSKKNAFVGIFYSNPHLTNLAQLTALDNLKAQLTHKPYISLSLRTKLKSITFKEGYERRRFAYFGRDHDLQLIVDGWKHAQ